MSMTVRAVDFAFMFAIHPLFIQCIALIEVMAQMFDREWQDIES